MERLPCWEGQRRQEAVTPTGDGADAGRARRGSGLQAELGREGNSHITPDADDGRQTECQTQTLRAQPAGGDRCATPLTERLHCRHRKAEVRRCGPARKQQSWKQMTNLGRLTPPQGFHSKRPTAGAGSLASTDSCTLTLSHLFADDLCALLMGTSEAGHRLCLQRPCSKSSS